MNAVLVFVSLFSLLLMHILVAGLVITKEYDRECNEELSPEALDGDAYYICLFKKAGILGENGSLNFDKFKQAIGEWFLPHNGNLSEADNKKLEKCRNVSGTDAADTYQKLGKCLDGPNIFYTLKLAKKPNV